MEAHKQSQQEIREALLGRALEGFSLVWGKPSAFLKLLDICERFNRAPDIVGGGPVNAMLVYLQRPQARQLVSNRQRTELGIYAKKGEHALDILIGKKRQDRNTGRTAVWYNPEKAFDASQLESAPEPEPEPPRRAWRDLVTAIGQGESADTYRTVVSGAVPREMGVGFFPVGEGHATARIVFNGSLEREEFVACALKGISHYILSKEERYAFGKESSFTAFCCGYYVCRRWGLETSGFSLGERDFPESVENPGAVKEMVSGVIRAGNQVYAALEKELERAARERAGPQNALPGGGRR